jgi:MFS family permease
VNEAAPASAGWLNRNVVGAGLSSLLADACYETATAILPGFLAVLEARDDRTTAIAVAALWVGLMEGLADGVSTSVKLAGAWWSERVGHRKAVVTLGYALTGAATVLFAVASAAWFAVVGRVIAWLGKGIRGPLRDAILADSVGPGDRGKVFGFHRAGDTVGAIIGPLLGAWLLGVFAPRYADNPTEPYRIVFLLALIPGLGAALAFGLLIREVRREPNRTVRLWASMRALPADFRRLLVGMGVFGAGDFAPSLLVLAAAALLTPENGPIQAAQYSALLYALRNVFYAAASFPVGALSDRIGRRGLLAGGYLLGAAVIGGFAATFATSAVSLPLLAVLFALAGTYIAFEDALSGAITADYVPDPDLRSTAYAVMGTVKGFGDLLSSVLAGLLWFLLDTPTPSFTAAAVVMAAGALLLLRGR